MAISKHIADLTRLAISDRVLTFRERETILAEARAEGIPDAETNAFLDGMLAQRLKSFSKEELKDCPACGAQIPLISDQCPFCGNAFASRQSVAGISGDAADIIRSENKKTEQPDTEPKNCPNCGAPFPLVSNICPHCGHVHHARQDSDLNIKNLIENINKSILHIQFAYKPTIIDVIMGNVGTIVIIFAVALLVSSFYYPGGWGICAFVVAIPLVFLGIKHKDGYSPVEVADVSYYTALNDHNMYVRLVESVYGDNPEAKKYISQLGDEIKKADRSRRTNRLIITIFAVILFSSMLLPLYITPSYQKYIDSHIDKNYTIFPTEQTDK